MPPSRINPFHEAILPPFNGFPKDALSFFAELKANNDKAWYEANKSRYLQSVREPMLLLLNDLRSRLRTFDSAIDFDPAKAVYRIYRDVRFSKDKTPYKTNIAAAFGFAGASKEGDAGWYFEISDTGVNVGAGLYMPTSEQLRGIRARIDKDTKSLLHILADKEFIRLFNSIQGERLTRVPTGYPPDHPAADLLRLKHYLLWAPLPAKAALKADLADRIEDYVKVAYPFVQWLRGKGAK